MNDFAIEKAKNEELLGVTICSNFSSDNISQIFPLMQVKRFMHHLT